MKNLRGKFERFCYRNQKKGIPNLMLWVIGLNVITYIFSMIDPSNTLYWLLCLTGTPFCMARCGGWLPSSP